MMQILPFVAGLVVGAAALSALRSERARNTLDEAGAGLCNAARTAEDGVRAAARSGLAFLRGDSAEAASATPAMPEAPATPETLAPKAPAKRPAARKKPAGAKPAASKRAPRKPKTPEAEE